MLKKHKPFLSKHNPLNIKEYECEQFSYKFFLPNYWLTWLGILLSLILNYLPHIIRIQLGTLIGIVIYITNKKRRNIAKTNISLCFKSMSDKDVDNLVRKYFKNLGRTFIDIPILWWRSDKVLKSVCKVKNINYIKNELSKGKGVILLTPHSTSIDFGGRSISEFPIISMYKPFRNELINWFVGKSRSKSTDNVVVYPRTDFPFKSIIKALKKPNIFYYIGDEDLGLDNSVFAKFFDEEKSTLIAIRKIVELTNCSVLPCINYFCNETKEYITEISHPLTNFPTNDANSDAIIINKCFEQMINKNLAEYMWSLRIFQTRKQGTSYPYNDRL